MRCSRGVTTDGAPAAEVRGAILARVKTTKATTCAAVVAVVVGGLLLGCDNAPATPEPGPRGPQVREFTVRSSDFSFSSDGTIATAVYRVPEITAEVVDGGVVAVHWDFSGDGTWWRPLPSAHGSRNG